MRSTSWQLDIMQSFIFILILFSGLEEEKNGWVVLMSHLSNVSYSPPCICNTTYGSFGALADIEWIWLNHYMLLTNMFHCARLFIWILKTLKPVILVGVGSMYGNLWWLQNPMVINKISSMARVS